jgi:hypothetical protein
MYLVSSLIDGLFQRLHTQPAGSSTNTTTTARELLAFTAAAAAAHLETLPSRAVGPTAIALQTLAHHLAAHCQLPAKGQPPRQIVAALHAVGTPVRTKSLVYRRRWCASDV